MKTKYYLLAAALAAVLLGAYPVQANPLMVKSTAPFGAPEFGKIKNHHFKPAFLWAMQKHRREIGDIAGSTKAPDFGNTIAALDYSGEDLVRIASIFFNLNSACTSPSLQKLARTLAPMLSKHRDDILLNRKLFLRVKAVYDARTSAKLKAEQLRLVEETYKDFIRSGISLGKEEQQRLRQINQELSVLALKFQDNVMAETAGFKLVLESEEDLAGLPPGVIAGAAQEALGMKLPGKWAFTLDKPSAIPFLQFSSKRPLREKLFAAYVSRGANGNEYDNRKVIDRILALRQERAKLLGFKSYAAYVLERTMAETPGKAYALLNQVWDAALPVAKKEASALQAMLDKDTPGSTLAPWDWWYYAEQLRKNEYDLDEESLRPYFAMGTVRDGVFLVVGKLYGLRFKERKDVPRYHPDVEAYEVLDEDGTPLGLLYMDYYVRPLKNSGAWCTNYRTQHRKKNKDIRPIVSVVCNFPRPVGDTPSLLSFDDVKTLFHEFGHALHELMSDCTYPSLSGTSVPRDFVELPSQVMENWAAEPKVMALYARHYKDGSPLPQAIMDRLRKSALFNQGFFTVEYLASAYLDMDYHTMKIEGTTDPLLFEKQSMDRIGLIGAIVPRHRSTYFLHSFTHGYAAGYYSYLWSQVLDADAYEAFVEAGDLFDKKTAKSFRDNILSKGNTADPQSLYLKFRGKEPTIKAYLARKGMLAPQ